MTKKAPSKTSCSLLIPGPKLKESPKLSRNQDERQKSRILFMGEAFSRGICWLSVGFCTSPAGLEDSLQRHSRNITHAIYHHRGKYQFRERPSQCCDRGPNLEREFVRDEVLDYDFRGYEGSVHSRLGAFTGGKLWRWPMRRLQPLSLVQGYGDAASQGRNLEARRVGGARRIEHQDKRQREEMSQWPTCILR